MNDRDPDGEFDTDGNGVSITNRSGKRSTRASRESIRGGEDLVGETSAEIHDEMDMVASATSEVLSQDLDLELDQEQDLDYTVPEVGQLHDEVMTSSALSKFPELSGLNNRDMMIMMGVAHGFSYGYIATALGMPRSTVSTIVKRIDPCGRHKLNDEGMKAFISQRARSKTAEALSAITSEKIAELSAVGAARVAKMTNEIAAVSDRKELGFGSKGVKKVTVEFVDEIDELRPISQVIEEDAY